jgi:hypothetical protein
VRAAGRPSRSSTRCSCCWPVERWFARRILVTSAAGALDAAHSFPGANQSAVSAVGPVDNRRGLSYAATMPQLCRRVS